MNVIDLDDRRGWSSPTAREARAWYARELAALPPRRRPAPYRGPMSVRRSWYDSECQEDVRCPEGCP